MTIVNERQLKLLFTTEIVNHKNAIIVRLIQ